MLKHICGQCQKTFNTEEDYLHHTCHTTGLNPVQVTTSAPTPKLGLSEKALLSAVRLARQAHQSHG